MIEIIVDIVLLLMGIYLMLGLLFSIYFLAKGAAKFDEDTKGSPWHFKLIIFPGIVLLWSILLFKTIRK
ncbi:MAG: hypothetical protein ABJP45_06835 [Cyclobacteriaceae bacterium]